MASVERLVSLKEQDIHHRHILTEDGSPSLETTYPSGTTEKMHHFKGAFSETVYIYGPAIDWALENTEEPSLMSLGLGLAYNEILTFAKAAAAAREIRLTTFEMDDLLVCALKKWISGERDSWSEAYDKIVSLTTAHVQISPESLITKIRQSYANGRWKILGRFPDALTSQTRFNGILYDAFSRKMDDGLWTEEFLSQFLAHHCDAKSCLATYAATGNLKRALKKNQFSLNIKPGFGGKKESTFAHRLDLGPLGIASSS